MAEIRQELVLEDKFSRVLDDFMKRLENIEKIQDRLAEQATEQNKHSEEMNTKFDRLNNTALRLANNGLVQLQRRLIALGASFIGARALYMSFMGAVNDYDMDIRFNNRSNVSGDINGYSRQLAMQYGGNASEYNHITANMSKYTNTNQMNRMQSLGARLASITPNMTVAEGMNAVNSAMYNRSGTGLINQFGLNANRSDRHQVDILLQQGRLDEALDIIERLSEQAGATEKSLNNMLDSPLIRIQRFQAQLDNIKKTIGDELLNALMPVIDAFDRLFKSEQFQRFVSIIGNVFKVLGQTVANVVNYIVDNWDRISQAIKRVLPYLGIALGLLGLYKVLMITIPPILLAVKGAIALVTAAQTGLNAAMMANPVGLVIAAVVGLIAALTALSGVFDKTHSIFARFIGVLVGMGSVLKNIFAYIYNSVGGVVIEIINIFGSLANALLNLDNPLVTLHKLFTDIFTSIAKIILDKITTAVEAIGWLLGLVDKVAGTNLSSGVEGIVDLLNKGKDWVVENKEKNDAWAKANGYREYLPTGLQFKKMAMEDPIENYNSVADWVDALISKFTSLGEKVDKNSNNLIKNANAMDNLGNIIDRDTWMDTMTFATSDAERKAVLNANKTYTDNSSTIFNVSGDNTLQLSHEIEKIYKEKENEWKRQLKTDTGDNLAN